MTTKTLQDFLDEQDVNSFETGIKKQTQPDDKNTDNSDELIDNEDNFTEQEIGRIYELKKLYARLLAILQFLQTSNDTSLVNLSVQVEKAVDLFELLVNNLEKYIDDIDKIIVSLYRYISAVYAAIEVYTKKNN